MSLVLKVETKFGPVRALASGLEKQLTYATAVALTRTAQEVRKELRNEIRSSFDRPTPWAMNSLYMRRAEKTDLKAEVWLKGEYPGDRTRSFMRPQIFGGVRPQKKFEQMLQRSRVLPEGWVTVPGKAAKLDRYGNQAASELVQILSALGSFPQGGTGFSMNRTRQSQKRRKSQLRDIFLSAPNVMQRAPNGGRLPWGVWERKAGRVQCLLFFVRRATYSKRLRFFEVADRVVKREWETQFDRAMSQALATAR
jgi:hypothetical protein